MLLPNNKTTLATHEATLQTLKKYITLTLTLRRQGAGKLPSLETGKSCWGVEHQEHRKITKSRNGQALWEHGRQSAGKLPSLETGKSCGGVQRFKCTKCQVSYEIIYSN